MVEKRGQLEFIVVTRRSSAIVLLTPEPKTPWICSGPPHLLGPWGRPVGRGEWPPRTATLRPATFLSRHEKGASRRLIEERYPAPLLDLRFLEEHVLPRLRIIFPERELVRLRAGILLRHIEVAGAFLADE